MQGNQAVQAMLKGGAFLLFVRTAKVPGFILKVFQWIATAPLSKPLAQG